MNSSLLVKALVLVVVGLLLATIIVPVSSSCVDQLSFQLDESVEEDSISDGSFLYPFDDLYINEMFSEGDDSERDMYERYPWRYDRYLRSDSEYPYDEPFSRYPYYEEFSDVYLQRFNDKYGKNHTLKDRKPIPKPNFADGKTWYVDDDGGADFTKIQDAINAASDGDTVFVYSGVYYENIQVDKSIILQGEDRNTTAIDGGGTSNVVYVIADWVTVVGFRIQNSGVWDAGIYVYDSHDSCIFDCIVSSNNGHGIVLNYDNYDNVISGNNITNNKLIGIVIWYSSNNTISGNNITNNKWIGVDLLGASGNNLIRNTVTYNKFEGISSRGLSNDNNITGNIIIHNNDGIYLLGTSNNNILNNTITNNIRNGIVLWASSNNKIMDNNFISDGIAILGDHIHHWNTHTIEGNFANGKLIYYYKNNHDGFIVPSDAGQVILANCTNLILKDLNFSNAGCGIQLGFSSNITILSNSISNNSHYGISSWYSSNNIIMDNNFISDGIAILGDHIHHWNTHTIENNFIDKRPIYYYRNNHVGDTVPSNASQVILANCSHFTIRNLTISNVDIGIQLGFSNRNIICNNVITSNDDDGIFLCASYNTIISNNIIANNTRHGIYSELSSRNNITGNNITNNVWEGVWLKSSSSNNISDNHIAENNDRGLNLLNSSYNNISGNTITNNYWDGIILSYSSRNDICRNTITNNTRHGIYSELSSRNNITGNNITINKVDGIDIFDSSYNNITGNNITNNTWNGIVLSASSNNKIMDNTIASNSLDGIFLRLYYLSYCNDNTISGNIIRNNRWYGIDILGSGWNTIYENIISSNCYGEILLEFAFFNTVSNCIIQNHKLSGIDVIASVGNTIQNCDILHNWRGIEISLGSMSNKITSCSISNNYWGIKLANSRLNRVEQCTFADNTVGIMRGKNNVIRKNNFIGNKVFDAFGELQHKNFWFRNYYSEHNSPLPCYLYGLNIDWFPKMNPYDYPTSCNVLGDDNDDTLWDWDDSILLERDLEELDNRNYLKDRKSHELLFLLSGGRDILNVIPRLDSWFDEHELSHYLDDREYLMDLEEESD